MFRRATQLFPRKSSVFSFFSTFGLVFCLSSGLSSAPQAPPEIEQKREEAIRKLLEAPPFFWDEKHQGPTMVPPDLPKGVAPMDCRAAQAFLHRVSPGQYHFQRAQYLLGAGPDFIGCEAFGLDRYQKGVEQDEKGVDEALAALRNPIGLEQWRPEAPRYVLARGYRALSKDYEVLAEKQGSAEYHRNAERLLETAKKVEESKALAPASSVETRASSCVAVSWFADAVKGDAVAVRKCLSTGTPADSRGLGGMTALMYAALSGKEEIARILLEAKADPNAQDNEGSSAFRERDSHQSPRHRGTASG